jgi:hypothetical protein
MNNLSIKPYLIFLFVIVIILTACQPDPLPIKVPKAASKLVVASQVIPNSSMIIALTRSFDALASTDSNAAQKLLDEILVAHAFVTIKYNTKTDTLFRISPGFYGSITTPLIDNVNYLLNVFDSSSGKSISAKTRMMPRIFMDTAWVKTEIKNRDTNRYVYIQFKDLPGQDYYMVNMYKNTSFIVNSLNNLVTIFDINQANGVSTEALSDLTFDNALHTEKILLNDYQKNDTLRLTLSHIESNYYTYLIQKQRSQQNGIGNFFGEPVNFTTNVKGGLGFFTAHWPDSRTIILKE